VIWTWIVLKSCARLSALCLVFQYNITTNKTTSNKSPHTTARAITADKSDLSAREDLASGDWMSSADALVVSWDVDSEAEVSATVVVVVGDWEEEAATVLAFEVDSAVSALVEIGVEVVELDTESDVDVVEDADDDVDKLDLGAEAAVVETAGWAEDDKEDEVDDLDEVEDDDDEDEDDDDAEDDGYPNPG